MTSGVHSNVDFNPQVFFSTKLRLCEIGIRNVEDLLAAKGEKVVRVREVGSDTPGTDLELLPKEH